MFRPGSIAKLAAMRRRSMIRGSPTHASVIVEPATMVSGVADDPGLDKLISDPADWGRVSYEDITTACLLLFVVIVTFFESIRIFRDAGVGFP
jgi:hypothetical protein